MLVRRLPLGGVVAVVIMALMFDEMTSLLPGVDLVLANYASSYVVHSLARPELPSTCYGLLTHRVVNLLQEQIIIGCWTDGRADVAGIARRWSVGVLSGRFPL